MSDWLSEGDFAAIPAIEETPCSGRAPPQVSVLMLAYGHAPFIAEAIESVLNQRCEESFELLIGEDASGDGTLDICRDYAARHPGVVRLVTSAKNVGMHRNFARLWYRARGPFIAFCEGDDYWTDPEKLDRQLVWFAEHPDGALCGSDCERLVGDGAGAWKSAGLAMPSVRKEGYTLADLLRHYTFHFSTVMVRKDRMRFPRWLWDVYCVDRPLYLLAAQQGAVGHVGGVTSRYREHRGGAWSQRPPLERAAASQALFRRFEQHLGHAYRDVVRDALAAILWSYMASALEAGDLAAARRLFWQVLGRGLPRSVRRRPLSVPTVFCRAHLPRLYRALRATV